MTYREYLEYVAAVESFYRREEIRDFSDKLNPEDPSYGEGSFSWHPCDCCRRPLGGTRYDVIARHKPSGEIVEFSVCGDCYYFNEYGRLDDSTMLEVSQNRELTRNAFRYARQQKYPVLYALKLAREDVAANRKRYPHTGKPSAGSWQTLESMPKLASADSRAYYCDEWPEGWREVGSAYDVCRDEHSRRVEHTGWYTDEYGDRGTLQGYVLQLPARQGVPQYVPAMRHSEWCGVTIYPLDRYDDKLDCAQAADGYAERAAEKERDYNAAWQAGARASDCDYRQRELRKEVIQLCRDLRIARRQKPRNDGHHLHVETSDLIERIGAYERLCEIARNKVSALLDDIREAREERDKLRDNVPASLMSAFNEGYGQ